MGSVPGGAGGGEFGGVGVREEGVEIVDGLGRADAAKGGEDDGKEDAALNLLGLTYALPLPNYGSYDSLTIPTT